MARRRSVLGRSLTSMFKKLQKILYKDGRAFSIEGLAQDVESLKGKKDTEKEFKRLYRKHLQKFVDNQRHGGDTRASIMLGEKGTVFNDVFRDLTKYCKNNGILPKDYDVEKTIRDVTKDELAKGEYDVTDNKGKPVENLGLDTKINPIDRENYNKDETKKNDINKDLNLNKIAQNAVKRQKQEGEVKLSPAFNSKLLQLAEKKYGKLSPSNRKDIESYIQNFDLSKDEYKNDVRQYLNEVVDLPHNQNGGLSRTGWQMYSHDIREDRWGYMKWMREDPSMIGPRVISNEQMQMNIFALESVYAKHTVDNKVDILKKEEYEPEDHRLYNGVLDEFFSKYKFFINHELIKDILKETKDFGEGKEIFYRKAFLDTFILVRDKLGDAFTKGHELMHDYEKVMQTIMAEEAPELFKDKSLRYGGLQKDEMKSFLTNLCESTNNITAKTKKEMELELGGNKKPTLDDVIRYNKQKIQEGKDAKENKEEKLLDCVGRLSCLQQQHMQRPSSFKFFHPFQNYKEEKAIKDLKNEISNCTTELSNELEAATKGQDVYRKGHSEELKDIDKFASNLEKDTMLIDPAGAGGKSKVVEKELTKVKELKPEEKELEGPVLKK